MCKTLLGSSQPTSHIKRPKVDDRRTKQRRPSVAISIFIAAEMHYSFVQVRNGAQGARTLLLEHSARLGEQMSGLIIATAKGAKTCERTCRRPRRFRNMAPEAAGLR
jgi:hypothetical protein